MVTIGIVYLFGFVALFALILKEARDAEDMIWVLGISVLWPLTVSFGAMMAFKDYCDKHRKPRGY